MRNYIVILSVAFFMMLPAGLAQEKPADTTAIRRATAVRIPNEQITIDGRLSEAAWKEAVPTAGFLQQNPDVGAAPTLTTEVRFVYDDDNLYVGTILSDPEPDKLIISDLKHDFFPRDNDAFMLILDTFHDRRNAYNFATNPMAAQREVQFYDDGRTQNQNWDAVWFVKTSVDETGWNVEMAIPFKSLRFPETADQVWGLNMQRILQRKFEWDMWSPVPRQYFLSKVSYAGILEGIRGVQPGRNIRVKPFFLSQAKRDNSRRETNADSGVDLKMGLGSNLVLDVTYRTDFSQVEAD